MLHTKLIIINNMRAIITSHCASNITGLENDSKQKIKNYKQEINEKLAIDINLENEKAINLTKKFTVKDGKINGKMTIKCKNGDIKTYAYIAMFLNIDVTLIDGWSCDIEKTIFLPNYDVEFMYDGLSDFDLNTVERLLWLLCENQLIRCNTWDEIKNIFHIYDRLNLSRCESAIQIRETCNNIYKHCIGNGLSTYGTWLTGLKTLGHSNNIYLYQFAEKLIESNINRINSFKIEHEKNICSCYSYDGKITENKCHYISILKPYDTTIFEYSEKNKNKAIEYKYNKKY